ncbi:MAG: hypothetical protein IKJ68_07225 [Clostridia bacterium]|nr:hypothetical protein [Clostridia bacterium]
MKMIFYNPVCEKPNGFGAASFGFAGAEDETAFKEVTCPFEIDGVMLHGTYEECLNSIPDKKWQAVIALLGNAGDENNFINKLAKKTGVPIVGGAGAINPVTGEKGLIIGGSEAAIFLVDDSKYDFEVISENIHTALSKHKISYSGRWINQIDGVDAKEWLLKQKEKFGIKNDDFEHLTLSDEYGINAHLSQVDGRIFSGRDLTETMYLRYIAHDEVQGKIQKFYDDKDAVIFGCAGLKGILDAGLNCPGTGLFMFGEVCTVSGHSDFGNLMLSKLRVIKK